VVEPRLLENLEMFFERAFSYSGLDNEYFELIIKCDNVVRIMIPLKRDDGSIEIVSAYRA
jgi:glutamate dehydrogenase (NAD(P)+)